MKSTPSKSGHSGKNTNPSQAYPQRWFRSKIGITLGSIVVASLAFLTWKSLIPSDDNPLPANQHINSQQQTAPVAAVQASTLPIAMASREELQKKLISQLEEVDHTLCSYREASKYPMTSRPISEHPDQIYPNQAITENHAMRKPDGKTDASIQISSSQSRVYLAANEDVRFSLQAKDANQQSVPLFVTRAFSNTLSFNADRPIAQVPLAFADNGRDGDAQANDGISSAILHPANSSFSTFNGTIRTQIEYTVNGQAGRMFFDVIYSPELPATWAGKIRDVIENGALVFYLPIEVRQAGRYIINARLDDAKGQAFALLNFNELLPQGRTEIKLTAAGNLLRDQEASFPMSLRDIDGYLLKENVDPDRALLPRIEAVAHKTKNYSLKGFSDAEPDTEERRRHLKEFSKDVELAKAALLAFDPTQALRPYPQSACSLKRQTLATGLSAK
nr:choice-of-anchor X domain-containing protein [uncultured Undibacterium sp.]